MTWGKAAKAHNTNCATPASCRSNRRDRSGSPEPVAAPHAETHSAEWRCAWRCASHSSVQRVPRASAIVSREGLEPSTNGLKVRCSAIELPARVSLIVAGDGHLGAVAGPVDLRSAMLFFTTRRPRGLGAPPRRGVSWDPGAGSLPSVVGEATLLDEPAPELQLPIGHQSVQRQGPMPAAGA